MGVDLKPERNFWLASHTHCWNDEIRHDPETTQDFWARVHPADVEQLRGAIEIAKQKPRGI